MSLGLHDRRAQQRRKFWWAIAKWTVAIAFIVAAGVYSYRTGAELARRQVAELEARISELREEVATVRKEKTALEVRLREVAGKAQEWKQAYERDVPSGPIRDLLTVVNEKLEHGVGSDRLKFLISSAENTDKCEQDPTTRRFIVSTPLYTGANDAVGFADGAITVTASGQSATDDQGRKEAWFDPAKPVAVSFAQLGGETSEAEGMLPIHHSVIRNNSEYKFSVVPGERGFVKVTGDRCEYP